MPYADVILGDLPVLYWRLGELTGTVAEDATANNRDGTYTNTPTLGVQSLIPGDPDPAITLARASAEVVERPDEAALDLAGAATCEAWIRFASLPASGEFHPVMTKNTNATEAYAISIRNNAGSIEFRWHINTGAATVKVFAFSPVINTTYHLVGTYDGANMRMYVNGVQVGGDTAKTGTIVANAVRFTVGSWSNGGDFFNGTIDEVALYDYALTIDQVVNHFIAANAQTIIPDAFRSEFPFGVHHRGPHPAGSFERFLFPRPTKSLRPPASPEDAYSTAMRALSPLAYWRLSEDQGEVVVLDCVGTSDGTAINDPPHQTAGLLSIGTDKCYDFNGTDERVDIPDAPPLRFTSGDFSVGAWVNTDNMPGVGVWRTIIHKTLGGQGWGLAFNNSRLYANTNSDGNGNTVLVAGTTYFVGFTFVSSAGEIRFFLNGVGDGVLTGKGSPGSSTTPLVIGSDSGGGSSYFDGRIDDAFIAPIALSAADWLTLYNAGTGVSAGFAASLKAVGIATNVLNTDFYSQAALNGVSNTSPPLMVDAVVNAPVNATGRMIAVGIVDAVVRGAVNGVGNTVDAAQVTMALASAINAIGKIVGAVSVQASVAAAINAIGTLSPSGSVNALAAAQINAIGSVTPAMNVGGAFRSAPNAVGRMITVPIVDAVMSTQPTAVGRITVPLQSVMALIAAAAGKGIINSNLSVLGGAPVFVHPEINLPTPLSIKSDPSSLAMAQAIAQIMLRTDTVVLSIKGNVGILALQERSSGIILATAETRIALKPETDSIQIDG